MWPNRGNCCFPSLINSQLLKAASAWWEPPVHPRKGWAPRIPHASRRWQGHQAWGCFQTGCTWAVSLGRCCAAEPKYSKRWLWTSKPWHEAKRPMRNCRAAGSCLLRCTRSRGRSAQLRVCAHPSTSSTWRLISTKPVGTSPSLPSLANLHKIRSYSRGTA